MRFYLVVKSTFQGYQASCERILRMYQASCEQIFCILAVWKFDCCRFVKPTFQGTSQRGDILHFWGLKMRFCPVVKSMFERYQVSWEQVFRKFQVSCEQFIPILSAWKCVFCQLEKPIFQGISQWEYINHILYFLHFSEMINLGFKLGMASLGFVWLGLAWHRWLGLAWLG